MSVLIGRRGGQQAFIGGVALLAIFLVASVWLLPHGVEVAALALFALAVVAAAIRPQWALFILVVGLPLHNMLMALLYQATQSFYFVKLVQPWKEVVLAVALARVLASRLGRAQQRRWRIRVTPLDVFLLAFAALCGISVLLPSHLIPLTGRLYGFRDLVLPFGAYVIGRLAPLSRREVKVLVGLLAADVLVLGLSAIGERALWGNSLLFDTNYGGYLKRFFGFVYNSPHNIPYSFYIDGWFPRAGSIALSPVDLAELVMITLPILLAVRGVMLGGRARGAARALGVVALVGGATLILAWSRAPILLLPLGLVILVVRGGLRRQWSGLALALAGAVLGGVLLLSVISFVAQGTNPADRVVLSNHGLLSLATSNLLAITQGDEGLSGSARLLFLQSARPDNGSTLGHVASLKQLAGLMIKHPLGMGLGVAGEVGVRFHTNIGAEDSFLSVGVQLGVLGFLLYLAVFAGVILICWRASRTRIEPWLRAVYLGAAVAWLLVVLNGVIAEITLNLFAMYLLFWLAGMAATQIEHSRITPATAPVGATDGAATERWEAIRPLRVAVDAQCLQTARTGVRTYTEELLRQFARPGSPHSVVPLRGPQRLPSGVRTFRIVNQGIYFGWLHLWLPLRLWLGNYDALFSPEYLTPLWSPVATIVTFHDTLFLRRPRDYNALWLRMFRWVTLPAIRRADAILTPSRYAAGDIAEYARIDPARIHAVPLGGPARGEPARGEPPRVDERAAAATIARFGLERGGYLLHVGVLERRKNLVALVEAFATWRRQGAPPNFKLALVGQPGPRPDLDDSAAILRAIADLGLGDVVVLTGHVTNEERDTLYARAAAVVIPSLFEGFGLPVLEAFAAQVPVVVARATSLPEVAGSAALFFDPAQPEELVSCLSRLAADPALRASLVHAGGERAAHFSWERTAAATLEVFEAAVIHAYAPGGAARARPEAPDSPTARPLPAPVGSFGRPPR